MADKLTAGTTPGVASSLIIFGDVACRVLNRLKEYGDRTGSVSAVIKHIESQLPALIDEAESLKQEIKYGLLINGSQSTFIAAVRSCEERVMHLDDLTAAMLPEKSGSICKRVTKALLNDNYEKEVSKAWAELGSHMATLTVHLTNSIMTSTHTPLRSPPKHYYNYPAWNMSDLVTREPLLREIEDTLCFSKKTVCPSVVVLLGMGGCGKTQLALKYCQQSEAKRRFTSIFWVDASNPKTVRQSFLTIAAAITDNIGFKDNDAAVQFVKREMGNWRDPWLIVFDNFNDPGAFAAEDIKDFLPQGRHGAILFIGRHRDVKRLGHTITVTEMLESEGLELLFQQSRCEKSDENSKIGKEIVHRLGNLALAIAQAGAYISACNLPLHLFIDHYNSRREKILRNMSNALSEYQQDLNVIEREAYLSVFSTWEMSFEQIDISDGNGEMKEHMLTVSAFFDNQDIFEEFFQIHFELEWPEWTEIFCVDDVWDRHKFQDILVELSKLSLLQNVENKASGSHFSVHPLIQDWMKLRLSNQDCRSYAIEAISMLSAFIEDQDTAKMTLQSRRTITSHLDASLQNDASFLSHGGGLGTQILMDATVNFASFYQIQDRYSEAEWLYRRALEDREKRLGRGHSDTLGTAQSLATIYQHQGRYKEAERLYRQALEGREKQLGPNHPNTLWTIQNLAIVCQHQIQYREAEQLHRQALERGEKLLGPDHSDTLETVQSLATVYKCQGRYGEAEQLYGRALKGREKQLGLDHLDTLGTVQGLADVYQHQGRYKEAEQLYGRVLKSSEKQLGLDHSRTLSAAEGLAIVYDLQGRYSESEQFHERVLEGNEKLLGLDHPDTLTIAQNLAIVYLNQGWHKKAERLCRRSLEGNEKQLGLDHPVTLRAALNLGAIHQNQGEYEKTRQLCKRALEGYEKQLGPDHPDTLNTVHSLATIYRFQGQHKKAEKLFRRALEGKEKLLGPSHPDTLKIAHNLGVLYQSQDRCKEAEQLYERALEGTENHLGPDHPNTLKIAVSLGSFYQLQGRHKEAEQLYLRALEGTEDQLGPSHPDTLRTVESLADLYKLQGRHKEAELLCNPPDQSKC